MSPLTFTIAPILIVIVHISAGFHIAAGRHGCHRRYRRRRGVDLRAALGQTGQREVGGISGAVLYCCAIEIDCSRRQRTSVLTGRYRVTESQRAGAGAAGVSRSSPVVERQCRGAAHNRHCLAHVERQRHRLAGIVVAARASITDDTVGVVVSICGLPWLTPVIERLAALPAPSCTVEPLRFTADIMRSGTF